MEALPQSDAVQIRRRGALLVLVMSLRPVNALTAEMRAGLRQGLLAADDESVGAVVICSDGPQFSAGLGASDFGNPSAAADLASLCYQIEMLSKPVIVALKGIVIGGGLEIALAAHRRIALANASMGMPDVGLGTVPAGGATQRLARLIGAGPTLRMLLDLQPHSAGQALAIGLVDAVVEENVREAAYAAAESMIGTLWQRAGDRRDGMRDGKAFQADIAAARAKLSADHLPAPHLLIDCIEAAQLLPYEQGLAFEQTCYRDLVDGPVAKGLRHAYFAERRAIVPPAAVSALGKAEVSSLAIWGAGDVSAELVIQALGAGLRVTLVEPKRDLLVETLKKIASRQEVAVGEGRLTAAARDADWARLTSTMAADGLVSADLVLANSEAGPVPIDPPAAIIMLGALPPRAAANRVALQPAQAAGLAAELSAGPEVAADLLAVGLAFGRKLGWKLLFTGPGGPIDRRLRAALSAAIAQIEATGVARATVAAALGSFGIGVGSNAHLPKAPPEAGHILASVLAAMANQGARLLSEGVARHPSDIDAVAVLSGIFPRWQGGPMFHADNRGLLVLRADLRRRADDAPQIFRPDPLLDTLIAEGRNFGSLNRGA